MSDGEQRAAYTKRAQCGTYSLTHDHKCALKHFPEHHRQFMLILYRNPLDAWIHSSCALLLNPMLHSNLLSEKVAPSVHISGSTLRGSRALCSAAPKWTRCYLFRILCSSEVRGLLTYIRAHICSETLFIESAAK